MATYTPNLNLKKPSTNENYDVVADLNDGKDKIDLAFKEVIDARQGKSKLADNIDDIKENLNQKDAQLISMSQANALDQLNIINYLGDIQNIHPKVLYFSTPWNGYQYWMAYTPYPDGDSVYENPCIAVSNNLINWTVPTGLVNPVVPKPAGNSYNSDTHLVYRADTDTLELWYRPVDYTDPLVDKSRIERVTTTDGVNWTAKQVLIEKPYSEDYLMSPSVIYEDGKYRMWTITAYRVQYRESTDAVTWSERVTTTIERGDLRFWHLDVIRTGKGLEFLITAYEYGKGDHTTADLYYVLQKSDGSYTLPELVLHRSNDPRAFDYIGIYRASLVAIEDKYLMFYSAIGSQSKRGMSLAIGTDIKGLVGLRNITKLNSRIKTIYNEDISDLDVSGIDGIFVFGNAIIRSFKGGYKGKELTVTILGTSSSLTLVNHSTRLVLPNLRNFTVSIENISARIICSNDAGDEWRAYGSKLSSDLGLRTLNGGEILTDYDLNGVDVIRVYGSTVVTANSFVGGYVGKRVTIILGGANGQVNFVYSTRLYPPGHVNYLLDNTIIGVDLICVDPDANVWKVMK